MNCKPISNCRLWAVLVFFFANPFSGSLSISCFLLAICLWMFSVCVQSWLDVQCLCPVLVGCSVSVPSVGWMFSVCVQCWLDLCLICAIDITAIQLRYCVFVMACNALICVCYRNIHHSISNQSEIPSPWYCDVPYLSKILLLPLLFRFLCFPSFPSFPALRT